MVSSYSATCVIFPSGSVFLFLFFSVGAPVNALSNEATFGAKSAFDCFTNERKS